MPETPQPTPPRDELVALDEPDTPSVTDQAGPSGPLAPASEPLIQADAKPDAPTETPVVEGPLQPATEPLTGQFVEADKPVAAVAATTPLTPATEPLIQAEPAQAAVPVSAVAAPALPAVPAMPQEFLTGSSLQAAARPKLPMGIYVIATLNLFGVIFGAVQPERGPQLLVAAGNFLTLLLAAGLVFRYERARKAAVVLAAVLVLMTGFVMFGLLAVKAAMDQNVMTTRQRVETVLSESGGSLSLRQRGEWQQQLTELETQRQAAGRALVWATAYNAAITLLYVGMIVYLTRPKVRAAFRPIEEKSE